MEKYENRQIIELKNNDLKLFGTFHQPNKEGKLPAVIFFHGLAGNRMGRHRMYVALSTTLSKAGIASFRFDYRGAGDSEGEIGDMTLEDQINDGEKALEWLIQHPAIDTSRIGLLGRSFGGAIALHVAERFNRFKSVALWAPVFDGTQWGQHWQMVESGIVNRKQREELMRRDGQLPSFEFYRQLFQMNLGPAMHKLRKVPFLHIHGLTDPVVAIQHAYAYERIRSSAKAESRFIRLKHSDHDFSHPEEKEYAMHVTTKWFERTL